MAEQITKIIKDDDEIRWDSDGYYVVRNGHLQEVFKYKDVKLGEKYCKIYQTPSTPADFGLILMEKNSKHKYHFDDDYIKGVEDYMLINPVHMKDFILGTKEFKNWYDE